MNRQNLCVDDIKQKLLNLKGKSIEIQVNRGRNRIETLTATIEFLYPSVFTIMTADKIETFSYCDVLCKKIIFDSLVEC